MSRTIKAVERHMIPQAKVPPVRLGLQLAREARRRMAAMRAQKHFPDMDFASCAWLGAAQSVNRDWAG